MEICSNNLEVTKSKFFINDLCKELDNLFYSLGYKFFYKIKDNSIGFVIKNDSSEPSDKDLIILDCKDGHVRFTGMNLPSGNNALVSEFISNIDFIFIKFSIESISFYKLSDYKFYRSLIKSGYCPDSSLDVPLPNLLKLL